MLVLSASHPKKAEPIPPNPKFKPKNKPAIIPTLFGFNSVAYTNIAENADEITNPIITASIIVRVKFTSGRANANGAAPRIDPQITYFRPYLSPILPPMTVPIATAPIKAKRHNWDT